MKAQPQHRLAYIDWLRGLACLVMFQTHCYDSWLNPAARGTAFFWYSQLAGSAPAPLFLFLAGVSSAFVTDRLRQKGIAASKVAHTTILRGAEVFGLSLLFRLQEFLLGWPYAPWTDLLRVDILNIIGLSLISLGITCWIAGLTMGPAPVNPVAKEAAETPWHERLRQRNAVLAALFAAVIVVATPPLWTTHRPRWLPWYLETYVNGVHTFDSPRPWLFPFFPWAAFAFLGLAMGFLLVSPWARRREWPVVAGTGLAGVLLAALGAFLMKHPMQLFGVYDFWHTSVSFFLMRVAMLLILLLLAYAWCHWATQRPGFSPVLELGRSSLLVYWVHIEFVYGGVSILKKQAQSIGSATLGLLIISIAMVALATLRNRTKGRGLRALVLWRDPARAGAL